MKKMIIAAMAVLALTASTALSATLIDRVVAIVGDDVITLSELQLEMAAPLAELDKRYRGEELARETEKLKRHSLNMLIDKKLQLLEAKVQGISVSPEEIDNAVEDVREQNKMDEEQFKAALMNEGYTLSDYRKNLDEQLTIIRLVSAAVRSKVMVEESDIQEYYDENKDRFTGKKSVRVANISFPAKDNDMDAALEEARKARQEIMDGLPFEEMAVKCTGDPGAAEKCELGTFGPGELSESINDLVFSMAEGEVSEPVKIGDGYQLIKVLAKTEGGLKPLEDVRGQVAEEVGVKKAETIFAKWIQELRDRTFVEIRD